MGQLAGSATSPFARGQEGDKWQVGCQPMQHTPAAALRRGLSICSYPGAQIPHPSSSSAAGAPGEVGWLHEGAGIGQVGQRGELLVGGGDTNTICKGSS